MRLASYERDGVPGVAVKRENDWADLGQVDLIEVLTGAHAGMIKGAATLDESAVKAAPPLSRPGKIICVGLNYADHTKESPYSQPNYPTLFPRFSTGLIADGDPLVRPKISHEFDYEGELVAIIGKRGRHISKADALDHVAGYSIFNDGSLRDYQFKSPQWTVGKNFDGTGAFGPHVVSADELPAGAKGLRLQTRLNGVVVQDANTTDMIYSVADLVSIISEAITLEPGDVLVTGTPAGVGMGREPKLYMKPGDIVEVEIEKIGVLKNPVVDEAA
jgi:acylpyruvate hydrolase